MPDHPHRRQRRLAIAGAAIIVGTGAGLAVSETVAAGPHHYITAIANRAGVTKTLDLTGTVEPVNQAVAAFQIAGTVTSVSVTQGQTVTAGEKIATLATTTLDTELSSAQTTLAAAQAKLTEDELDETSSSTSGTAGPGSSAQTSAAVTPARPTIMLAAATYPTTSTGSTGSGSRTSSGGTGASGSITADQQAVVADQHAVDVDMQTAEADLAAVVRECPTGPTTRTSTPPTTGPPSTTAPSTSTTTTTVPPTSTTTPATTTTTTASASPDFGRPTTTTSTTTSQASTTIPSTSTTTPSTSTTTPSTTSAACSAALTQAEQAEARVDADQKALATAETTLADALSAAAKQSTSSSHSSTSSTTRTGTSSSSTSSTHSSTTQVNTDTPQQLAADEATIDSDQASVVDAQQNLAAATLTSPITGAVQAVDLTAGQTVTSGSSTEAITITGSGSYEADATLTTSQVPDVAIGDTTQVTVNGLPGAFTGTVTRVGPAEESDSTYTYPVVIALEQSRGPIPAGSDAQLDIDLHSVSSALAVPTSAVHTIGTTTYVLVDKHGVESEQVVKVGVVGDVYTQILSGLAQGAIVVLADPAQAVPSSSTNTSSRSGAGGFTFTGGGAGGFAGLGGSGFTGGGGAGTGGTGSFTRTSG